MTYFQSVLIILTVFATSVAVAEDFKTVNGKEYKNATISRVEPDGIALITKTGVSKIYFTELPKEVQQRFHYDPVKAVEFNAAVQAAVAQFYAKVQQEEAAAKEKAAKEKAVARAQQAQAQRVNAQQEEAIVRRRPVVSSLQSIGGGGGVSPY